jgi:hypothetical protein
VPGSTIVVGSIGVLSRALRDPEVGVLAPSADVVVVTTGAAFTGAAQAALEVTHALEASRVRVEALMVLDRSSNAEPYFVERIAGADLVVLCDGSPLHARLVWRDSPVGAAIEAAPRLVAIGSVASVLGATMIDPRGGAPTTGLGYRPGVVLSAPASEEQMTRTRNLLDAREPLVVVGPSGVVVCEDRRWRVALDEGVEVTRGTERVDLGEDPS